MRIFLIMAFLFSNWSLSAQSSRLSFVPNLSLSVPLLDNGIGAQIGLNPSMRIVSFISLEGQVSYNYTQISDSFLSGNAGSSQTINAFIGPRVYLSKSGVRNRLYLNLLVGNSWSTEKADDKEERIENDLGLATGLFLERERIVFGLSLESPQNLMFKFGLVF